MGSESKKRKISHDNEEEDDEDDEEKMEKFFALIKRIREARDQLMKCSDEFKARVNKNKKQKVEEEKPNIAAWNPAFQREDFMDDAEFRNNPLVTLVGTSQRKEGAEKEDTITEGLDLKLSL